MSAVIGIAALVALFLAFPLIKRERGPRECGSGGCWKKKIGFGCGECPLDEESARPPARTGNDSSM